VREHLRVVAADVLDDPEWFAGLLVDKVELGFFGDFVTPLVHQIAGMGDIFRLLEFLSAGFPEHLADLGLELGEFAPCFKYFRVVTERGDAGRNDILVAAFCHYCELAGDDGHCGFLRDGVAVVGDAATGGVVLVVADIASQQFASYLQEIGFGGGEKVLAYAAPGVEPVVIRNFLLIV
jgi:hypothetical protein